MNFESLVHKIAQERHLVKDVISELQSNFSKYQEVYFFIKLEKREDSKSEVVWIKAFTDFFEYRDFSFNTKFKRASILVRFKDDHYKVFCRGFFFCCDHEIFPTSVEEFCISESPIDPEKQEQLPWEFLNAAFGELQEIMSSSSDSDDKAGAA